MGERRSAIIVGLSVVIVVGLVLVWAFSPPSGTQEGTVGPLRELTDPAAIQDHVQLSRLGIATSENYVGHRIPIVSGVLRNISDATPIRTIELKMVFTDFSGGSVHEYVGTVLESNQQPLHPGSEYRFEVYFDDLPREWNYRVPVAEVSNIGF